MKDAEQAFMESILAGHAPTPEEVTAYVVAFHERLPRATSDVMCKLRATDGRTSYDILADVIAAAKPKSILDAGCGDGTLLAALRARCPNAQLYGVDLTAADLAIAATLSVGDDRVDLQSADVTALPFADATLDSIASHLVFMVLPDVDAALAQAHRVLRPGGMLALLLPRSPDTETPLLEILAALTVSIRRTYPKYIQPSIGDRVSFDPDAMATRFNRAGFTNDAQVLDFTVGAMFDGAQLWESFSRRYFVGSFDPRLTGELRANVIAAVGREGVRFEEALRVFVVPR